MKDPIAWTVNIDRQTYESFQQHRAFIHLRGRNTRSVLIILLMQTLHTDETAIRAIRGVGHTPEAKCLTMGIKLTERLHDSHELISSQ